jgi:uncharacterized protein with HEPN domain
MKTDLLYLKNIQDCIQRIESYTIDGTAKFLEALIIQDAVVRNFEIIGEATKRLSPELKNAYPDVAWKQIAGLRDILIHDYLKVNLNRVRCFTLLQAQLSLQSRNPGFDALTSQIRLIFLIKSKTYKLPIPKTFGCGEFIAFSRPIAHGCAPLLRYFFLQYTDRIYKVVRITDLVSGTKISDFFACEINVI